MKLQPSYETQEDVPEGLADYYTEVGGRFVLQVEGHNVDGLEKTLQKELRARKDAEKRLREAEDKLSQFGDRDPSDVLKELDEIEELRAQVETKGGADDETVQKRIDAAIKRAVGPKERELEKLQRERDEYAGKAEELSATINKRTIEASIRDCVPKVGIRQEAVHDALLYASQFEVSEDGVPVHSQTQETPDVYFQRLLPDRPHWSKESVGGGSRGNNGSGGAGGANPFDLKAPDVNAAMSMLGTSPDKAKQLMGMAGHSDPKAWAREAAKVQAKK